MDEKNRLGDKLRDVERGREDQYFARRDRDLIAKLRAAKEEEREQAIRDIARMRCPKCGERLEEKKLRGVAVDECRECKGMWLDRSELKQLVEAETETSGYFAQWVGRWLRRERDD